MDNNQYIQGLSLSDPLLKYVDRALIDEKEAALFLGFKIKTLQGWRYKGGDPEQNRQQGCAL